MKIYNGTPHDILIISKDTIRLESDIRKFVSNEPKIIKKIPSNGVLSAKIETVEGEKKEGIPIFKKQIVGCDTIPIKYDIVVVSALYVSACRAMGWDTSSLYTIADTVYSEDGRTILGCRGICPVF